MTEQLTEWRQHIRRKAHLVSGGLSRCGQYINAPLSVSPLHHEKCKLCLAIHNDPGIPGRSTVITPEEDALGPIDRDQQVCIIEGSVYLSVDLTGTDRSIKSDLDATLATLERLRAMMA